MNELESACKRALVQISNLFNVKLDEVKNIMLEVLKI